ncbi:hypothetical protein MGN70_012142 [Eutypa lata]|nr:hypothetical protein MGN70_012142 [Eutypa lata]
MGAVIRGPINGLTARNMLPDGYKIVPMTWTGPVVDNGHNHTYQGTVEQITAYINNARIKASAPPLTNRTTPEVVPEVPDFTNSKLDSRRLRQTLCNAGLPAAASAGSIDQGIKYLQGLEGDCALPAGPGVCGRISCSWCNDNDRYVSWKCSDFAVYAEFVRAYCSRLYAGGGVGGGIKVWGQAFDEQNFNIMVGEDYC